MSRRTNPIVVLLVLVGLCAVLYGLWHLYQRQAAQQQHERAFSEPAPSGVPNFLNATPGAPPPQP
jgi:cytochrome c-type biogenesis protein CcmH/NrfG